MTAVPARHGPEGAEPTPGVVTGFVLRADGWPTVYVSEDNASLDVVDEDRPTVADIDIAVLFVGGADVGRFGNEPLTLDAARASAAADLLPGAPHRARAPRTGHLRRPARRRRSASWLTVGETG